MFKNKHQAKIFFLIITFIFVIIPQQKIYAQSDEVRIANEYYFSGEFEKAKISFEKISKNDDNLLFIYQNYFNTLQELKENANAQKLAKKMIKLFPEDVTYKIDHYLVSSEISGNDKSEKEFQSFLNEIKNNPEKVERAGEQLINKNKVEKAKELYFSARKSSGEKTSYAMGLANIYSISGETEKMIDELLNYLEAHPSSLENIKNAFQNNLNEKSKFDLLENVLYSKIQKNPEQISYNELLLWLNIQHKNFTKAFMQAKAIDKRNKMQGSRVLEVGQIAEENHDYDNAIKYFQYVIDEYRNGFNYSLARRLLINVKEEKVKNTFPLDSSAINSLINDYKILIDELGKNSVTIEAMRSMAMLYAFYKNDRDTAIVILNDAIAQSRYEAKFKDKVKIDLGDIYLLKGEPWESTLLYSQVEKSQKEEPLGHEAKLRNAKLAYYKGDFELAQAHLDVLKLATTREISNDAMDLSLLIQDNLAMDTTGEALREYAHIDLLLFQNKTLEALQECDDLLKKFPQNSLTDEVYWLKAKIYKKTGDYSKVISMLDKVTDSYANDILGDDALYMKAVTYEENLNEPEKAKVLYQELITKYPGSIFGADARKRYRQLRGDKL